MIGVITDITQSTAIIIWLILTIMTARRVTQLRKSVDNRLELTKITDDYHKAARLNREPEAICGCSHHQCFHDETSCAAEIVHFSWSRDEGELREIRPCGCKRYTGPEQLPQVIP